MIKTSDRVTAMAGCFAGGAIVVGAKASAVVLGIWAFVALLSTAYNRRVKSDEISAILQPSMTALVFLVFALFVGVSGLWANNSTAAIKAAALLALILILGHLLKDALKRLSPAAAVLVAGWFVIGVAVGSAVLMSELNSNFLISRWLFETFPSLRPSKSSFVQAVGPGSHTSLSISKVVGNWNVAGFSLLLWPTLLLLSLLTAGKRLIWAAALLAFCAAITFMSDHQTSQVAVVISAAVFALAHFAPNAIRRTAIVASVALIAGVVPMTQFAFQSLELQNASWAQYTLKERFRIWGNSSAHVPMAPVLGIGADNTTNLQTDALPSSTPPRAAIKQHHPHNMVLQIWLELGAVGAGLLLLGCIATIGEVSRMHPRAAPFGYATLAMIALQAVATWSLWSVWIQAIFVISWCLLFLGNRILSFGDAPLAFGEIWLPKGLRRSRQHV